MSAAYPIDYRSLSFTDDHHDGFAGGGGASLGYEQATGRPVTAAYNHNPAACRMHHANHRRTRHYCEDFRRIKPRGACRGRRPGSAHFSPDCRDFSKAKGGKPKSKRVRGLAWTIIYWINEVSPGYITWENVEEFEGWCPLLPDGSRNPWRDGWFFRCLTGAMFRRGYIVQWRGKDGIVYRRTGSGAEPVFVGGRILRWSGRASEFGAPTIRQRHFGQARCDGLPISWPRATHAPAVLRGMETERTAADCLDFARPCPSIFLTAAQARRQRLKIKRPIVAASCQRIAKGVKRFVMDAADPFLVSLTHQGNDGVESVRSAFKTITAANRGEKALVSPVLAVNTTRHAGNDVRSPMHTIATGGHHLVAQATLAPFLTEHANATHQRNFSVNQPLRTSCAQVKGGHFALVSTHVVKMRGKGAHSPGHDLREPLAVISSGGTHFAQAACFLAQNNGGMVGHKVTKPVSTIMGRGTNQSIVAVHISTYYGTEQAPDLRGPMHTVPTKDRFACVEAALCAPPFTPELEADARRVAKFLRKYGVEFEGEFATVTIAGTVFVIVDIGMRMLTARELFRAQGFPESYIIGDDATQGLKLTKTQQVHMCGNSVCPPIMAAIYRANLRSLRRPNVAGEPCGPLSPPVGTLPKKD